jgi:hypothetical protein
MRSAFDVDVTRVRRDRNNRKRTDKPGRNQGRNPEQTIWRREHPSDFDPQGLLNL